MLMKPPVRHTRITKEVLDRNAGEIVKIRRLAEVEDGPITAASVEGVKLAVKDGVADVPDQFVPRLQKEGWTVVRPSEAESAPTSGTASETTTSQTSGDPSSSGTGASGGDSGQSGNSSGNQGARQGGGSGKPR